jgi:hypothetical protein
MPTYMLEGDRSVTVSSGPIRAIATSTAGAAGVELVAAVEPVHTLAPRPGLLIVPALSAPAVLRVVPIGAVEFAVGTSIGLTIERESGGGEPERVLVGPVDVAGLRHRDLVFVEPAGGRLTVGSVAAVHEEQLSDVAAATRAAARTVGNATTSNGTERQLAIALDASASMAPHYRNGSIGAVVEMIAGLDALVPKGSTLPIALVGEAVDWQPDGDPLRSVATLTSLPGSRVFGSTAAFERVVPPPASDGRSRLVVRVTDEPSAAAAPGVHTVLLIASSAVEVVGVDPATTTVIEPDRDGASIPERLAATPAEFRTTVESLLRGLAAAAEEVPA